MASSISDRLRIVHVTFGLDVGGQEKLLVEFARHADRERHDLSFASLGSKGELSGEIESLGWPVVALGAAHGLRPSLAVKLAGLFRRHRPDVVHCHDQRALFYAGPAARVCGVPTVVYTRHGRDVNSTNRQTKVFRQLAKLIDRFVCVSDEVAALSRQQGINDRRICTILNGIDVGRFRYHGPRPMGPALTVARLSPEKDVANLVNAAALVAPKFPELRVEIAGAGPCLAELQRLVASTGVAHAVAFLGEVRDVETVLGRARMFVLGSRSEGIPLTVLEAMACGLPVVGTRVGGVPEVVVDRETGLLVPPSDPSALAHAIASLWNDPESCERMGRAGRRRAEELFDVRRMVAQYEALYIERAAAIPRLRAARAGAGAVDGQALNA
jgi:glycosyltransferase involved in cell wall biosynthesis